MVNNLLGNLLILKNTIKIRILGVFSVNVMQFKHELDIGGSNTVKFIEDVSFDKNRNTASEIADHARKEEKGVQICFYFSPVNLRKKKKKSYFLNYSLPSTLKFSEH